MKGNKGNWNKTRPQSKDVWPGSFLAHSLRGKACTSSVLVPKNPQWDQKNSKSNTVNGKATTTNGSRERGRARKKAGEKVRPPTRMQRLMMTFNKKKLSISGPKTQTLLFGALICFLNSRWVRTSLVFQASLWKEGEAAAVLAVLAITSSSMYSCPIAWPLRSLYKLAGPQLFNTGIKE